MEYPSPLNDPYAGYPPLEPGMVLHKIPPEPVFLSDPEWYDTLGGSRLLQYDVFNQNKTAEEQIRLIKDILHETPRDPDEHDRGYEILYQAGVYGSEEITRWLLKDRDANLGGPIDLSRGPPSWDETILPLHAAAFRGNLGVVKCLIEEGRLPVDLKGPVPHETALMRAAFGGHVDVVCYLIEKGANPAATTSCPREDRDQASDRDVGMADAQNDYDCDCHASDDWLVITPIDHAARSGNAELLVIILDAIASKSRLSATRKHAHEQLRSLVQPFTMKCAAQSGSEEVVSFLLRQGGDGVNLIDGQSDQRRRRIIEALPYAPKTSTGSLAVAALLLDSVLAKDNAGKYVTSDDAYLAEALANGVANAASRGYPDMLRLYATVLRDSLASTVAGNPEAFQKLLTEQALARCFQPKTIGCASVLIHEFGVDVNSTNPENAFVTVLDSAIRMDREKLRTGESIEYFLNQGADLHLGRGAVANGPTPLWIAVRGRKAHIVKKLLDFGGPIEGKDESLVGAQRLCIVAEHGYRSPVRLFVDSEHGHQVSGKSRLVIEVEGGVTQD